MIYYYYYYYLTAIELVFLKAYFRGTKFEEFHI